jgi:hypothetical protein
MARSGGMLAAIVGLALGLVSNLSLIALWLLWSSGPWADCPNYAFGAAWYPVPPIAVVLVPLIVSGVGIASSAANIYNSCRNGRRPLVLLDVIGLASSCVPGLVTILLPILSHSSGLTQAGC